MALLRVRAYLLTPLALTDPLHLDGLASSCHPDVRGGRLTRGSDAANVVRPTLPIASITHEGHKICVCSAAEVAPDARRSREHLTRRRDAADVDHLAKPVHTRTGPSRDVMLPYAVWLTPYVEWWCVGARRGLKKLMATRTTHVGAMRRIGFGAVDRWQFDATSGDPAECLVLAGRARRNLPIAWCDAPDVVEQIPVTHPYWHATSRADGVRQGRATGLVPEVLAKLESLC